MTLIEARGLTFLGEPWSRLDSALLIAHFLGEARTVNVELPRPGPQSLRNAELVLDNCFELVGERYTLPENFSWRANPSRDKEWQIAQHKFYFAVDLAHAYRATSDPAFVRKWVSLLESWLAEMGSGFITASDAQVEARRVESWLFSLLLLHGADCGPLIPPGFLERLLERIADETQYIAEHLKSQRNHRTFQLWSMFLVGLLLPELRQSPTFLRTGRELLIENLLADFLPDGTHVELSTHYHQLSLEVGLAFVDAAFRNGLPVAAELLRRLERAVEFSMWMQWPDGSIPLLNDSDDGDQTELLTRAARRFANAEFDWSATRGRVGVAPRELGRCFDSSGYFAFTNGWGFDPDSFRLRQHVLYDAATLGEGSHSHYDLFNFTYFCDGAPAIVDPGRYTYSPALDTDGVDWRQVFKSTAAHNTVTIDGRDQTHYISKLLPRRPGAPKHGPAVELREHAFWLGERTDWVLGTAHSAEYNPLHQRLFVFVEREYVLIVDRVFASDDGLHSAVQRFHLAADLLGRTYVETREADMVVRSPRVEIYAARVPCLSGAIEQGWVSTQYGVKVAAPVAAFSQSSRHPMLFCSAVVPAPLDRNALRIDRCLATGRSDSDWLFRVDGARNGSAFTDWLFTNCETGHFTLRRYDAQDQLLHVVASGADVSRHIEWTAPR